MLFWVAFSMATPLLKWLEVGLHFDMEGKRCWGLVFLLLLYWQCWHLLQQDWVCPVSLLPVSWKVFFKYVYHFQLDKILVLKLAKYDMEKIFKYVANFNQVVVQYLTSFYIVYIYIYNPFKFIFFKISNNVTIFFDFYSFFSGRDFSSRQSNCFKMDSSRPSQHCFCCYLFRSDYNYNIYTLHHALFK